MSASAGVAAAAVEGHGQIHISIPWTQEGNQAVPEPGAFSCKIGSETGVNDPLSAQDCPGIIRVI